MSSNRPGEGAQSPPQSACEELSTLLAGSTGDALNIANEFAEVVVRRVTTRNGARLLIQAPKSAQWVSLDALEIEALTWQNPATLAAMVGNAGAPLILGDEV
ncbi:MULTISPECIES: hypothetical protein [Mycobacteriaceae]|jgi:hypothetical protein|uniref:Dihydrodiol dehydrogenase n=1 Tax=Mycolicibacterium rhodesiae (strain NBB3) TaxID=710685 RepID=G8RML0_MYCRN|nr:MULTISPECIES: hypothetical protein [Mycobacteriaceae]AEV73677.1 hypothetical protein MycrhN_3144 [Mycolicibacterium rhodesiae NBB3]MDX1887456.1 hypothetical protein [Mycolicibacterium sp. 120270]